jgi:hypothetical protein
VEQIAPILGLLGLIGLAGLANFKYPVDRSRSGSGIRLLALLGLLGIAGFWVDGAGATGAFGAIGLWNHQSPKLALWGKLGWFGLVGLPFVAMAALALVNR